MTYDIYRYIFIGAAIMCCLMFIVSIVVFILLKIPKVISDLSGATARKAIKSIREQNEASGDKNYKVSALNQARGKLTDKISQAGYVISNNPNQMTGINTSKIETQRFDNASGENQTTILETPSETTVLNSGFAGETSVLTDSMVYEETNLLSEASNIVIEYEITFIHTDEIIPAEVYR